MLLTSAVSVICASLRSSLEAVIFASTVPKVPSISLMVMCVTPKFSWEWALSQVQPCAKPAPAINKKAVVMAMIFFMLFVFLFVGVLKNCCLNIEFGMESHSPGEFITRSPVLRGGGGLFSG